MHDGRYRCLVITDRSPVTCGKLPPACLFVPDARLDCSWGAGAVDVEAAVARVGIVGVVEASAAVAVEAAIAVAEAIVAAVALDAVIAVVEASGITASIAIVAGRSGARSCTALLPRLTRLERRGTQLTKLLDLS